MAKKQMFFRSRDPGVKLDPERYRRDLEGRNMMTDISIDPEQRLCVEFDSTGITYQSLREYFDQVGLLVVDNAVHEHIM